MARMTPETSHPSAADKRFGIAAMCLAMVFLPLGDAISTTLTGYATPFEVTAWRMIAQAVFFVPLALVLRRQFSGSVLSLPALLSACLIVTVTLSLISAFATMPIATASPCRNRR